MTDPQRLAGRREGLLYAAKVCELAEQVEHTEAGSRVLRAMCRALREEAEEGDPEKWTDADQRVTHLS